MDCRGVTAAGAPCTAKAKTGNYCGRHAGSASRAATVAESAAARAAEQQRLFATAASEMAEATKHLKAASAAAAAGTHMDAEIVRNLHILGLNNRAHSPETIKKAFRSLALKYHPDTSGLSNEKEKKAAEERFKKVREAFVNLRAKLGL
jgi:hypothetical protein